jgi:hypothetical protein
MSRNVNIDLTKSLKSHDPDDLRYALDRMLIPEEDRQRVKEFLDGNISGKSPAKDQEELDENEAQLLATLDGSVGEVNARVEDDATLGREQIDALIAAEKEGKDRKGVLEYLESIRFEGEEGYEAPEES